MMKDRGPVGSGNWISCRFKTLAPLESIHCDAYTGVIILIVGFIINYEIYDNKFSSKITRYAVSV